MFEIAAKEASRLERLTGDFLTYARPGRQPNSPTMSRNRLDTSATYAAGLQKGESASIQKPPQV